MRLHRGGISREISQSGAYLFVGYEWKPGRALSYRETCYCVPHKSRLSMHTIFGRQDDCAVGNSADEFRACGQCQLLPGGAREHHLTFS